MGCNDIIHCIVKYTIFIINLIFTLAGFASGVAGIVVYLTMKDKVNSAIKSLPLFDLKFSIDPYFKGFCIFLVVLGIVLCIISICGMFGSLVEKKVLLTFYAVFLCLLMAPKIYGAVTFNQYHDKCQILIKKTVDREFAKKPIGGLFSGLEVLGHCCGTKGSISYQDISITKYLGSFGNMPFGTEDFGSLGIKPFGTEDLDLLAKNRFKDVLPPTCCAKKVNWSLENIAKLIEKYSKMSKAKDISSHISCTKPKAHRNGCRQVLYDWINSWENIIKKIIYGLIAVELLLFFGAIYLCVMVDIKNKKKEIDF